MPFHAVRSSRLYRQVAEQIAELIASGELAPGARLPAERELSVALEVSRPTLREAMIALELVGLVEVRTGSGVYVTSDAPSRSSALDAAANVGASPLELTDARLVVECAIAAEAARCASPADVEKLRACVEDLAAASTLEASQRADSGFHIGLAQASGNSMLVSIVEALWNEMASPIFLRFRSISGLSPDHEPPTILEHRAILAAIEAGDAAAAEAAMRTHLKSVRSYLAREWQAREPGGDAVAGRVDAA